MPEAAIGQPDMVEPAVFDATVDVNLRGAYVCARDGIEYERDIHPDDLSTATGSTRCRLCTRECVFEDRPPAPIVELVGVESPIGVRRGVVATGDTQSHSALDVIPRIRRPIRVPRDETVDAPS
jgi:hypothetical protein